MAYFRVPINLPHAATISKRIERRLWMIGAHDQESGQVLLSLVQQLRERIGRYEGANDPPDAEAGAASEEAARIGRLIVDEIERLGIAEDRLGQTIRNLFECL